MFFGRFFAFGIGRGQDGTCQKSHPPGHTFVSLAEPFPKKKPLEEVEVSDAFCCPPFLSQDSRCFSFVHILQEMIKADVHFAIPFLINLVVYSSLLDGFFITTFSKSSDFENCTSLDIKSNDAIGSKQAWFHWSYPTGMVCITQFESIFTADYFI